MLIAAPKPRSGFPPLDWTPVTPACNVASCAQSRPFNGVSRTVEALTFPLTVGEFSDTGAEGASVLATRAGSPTRITALIDRSTPAIMATAFHSCVTNPGADMVMSYRPGGRLGAL